MSEHTSGAYTGEIAADMLASVNATGAIIGHLREDNTMEKLTATVTEK